MKKNHTSSEIHEFALFYPPLSQLKTICPGTHIVLDEDTSHRIQTVLRLTPGESCILFDGTRVVTAVVNGQEGKKGCRVTLTKTVHVVPLAPAITFYLPLLKREALELAVYSLVEMGINTIQLFSTAKAQRAVQDVEYKRLERIMIAAAEQSKNFCLPTFKKVCSFTTLLEQHDTQTTAIYFDAQGQPLAQVLSAIANDSHESITCMIGPEGDLTAHEKEQLTQRGFIMCALTPTIMRSFQAAAVGSALIRSIST